MNYSENKLSIKQWHEDDQPREKLMLKGSNALSDSELLAILIGSGNREESALALCKRILHDVSNDLNHLGRLTLKQLMAYKGIGEAKAITIAAALELGKRRRESSPKEKPIIRNSNEAYNAIGYLLEDLAMEEFWLIHLNHGARLTKLERISIGGIAATIVDLKLIGKTCLENLTSSVILCHNHPSGNLQPSEQDNKLTKKIQEALLLFDIAVRDHIIIGGKGYYSYADNGNL